MGAGVPREIPGILDELSGHNEVQMNLNVDGAASGADFMVCFNPSSYFKGSLVGLNWADRGFLP